MTSVLTRWKHLRDSEEVATVDPHGARVAAYTAQLLLEKERKRAEQTTQVSKSLHELRERDHFADLIIDTMGR